MSSLKKAGSNKKKGSPVENPQEILPQLTFSETEVQQVADFINFVFNNASWSITSKEVQRLAVHFANIHKHVSKMEDHIFEIKKVIKRGRK